MMTGKTKVFFTFTKADETDSDVLTIEGLAQSGRETDRGGERLDYPGSKPFFERWRDAISAATGGKSQGNIREQHDSERAVGKVEQLIFDDAREEIRIVGKIFDSETRRKILAGVLSGLSIAGRYVKRWTEDGIDRYICEPSEISVCDFPALPSATFQVVSKSGAIEHRQFRTQGESSMTRADHHECAKRSLAMAEHHEALGKLHREAHAHHTKMMNDGPAASPKAATADFAKSYNEPTVDPSGGLRRPV
jgi:hypothetical protein